MQDELMKFDPATGEPKPYPSHAEQWRRWYGLDCAWLYNPWTGETRTAWDIGSDVNGRLCDKPTTKRETQMNQKPQKIAWEERYSDDSGVEFAVRYDATRSNDQDGGPVVTIEHIDSVDLPLPKLDWLIECLSHIRDLAHNAELDRDHEEI